MVVHPNLKPLLSDFRTEDAISSCAMNFLIVTAAFPYEK